MYDTIIRNGRIIDGTGSPWYRGDIGITNGKIEKIGMLNNCKAAQEFDADENYIAPGFIDIHTHSDKTLHACGYAESRIFQGVTTEIGGNCGMSPFPVSKEHLSDLKAYMASDLPYSWEDISGFLEFLEEKGTSTNFGSLTGHGSIRLAVMGMSSKKPTEEQLNQMCKLAQESMEQGSFGISSGLIYPPGSYSDKEEMIAILKTISKYGCFYATHMKNESKFLVHSVKEAIEVAEKSKIPLQISHHKSLHKPLWGKAVYETTKMIEDARERGLDVTCDQYPYIASATVISSNIPSWGLEGGFEKLVERLNNPEIRKKLKDEADENHIGRWQDIFVSSVVSNKNTWMVGKNLVEIGETLGKSPADVVFDLVEEEHNGANEVNFGMSEEDIEYIMAKTYVMPGSDGEARTLHDSGNPHPRNYGTFPKVIAHYCRERKLFSLEESIRKMTAMPAGRIGLTDRGTLKKGMCADILVFDYDKIKSNPTYEDPKQACDGIKYVFVNGVITAKDNKHTKAKAGKILRLNK